MARGDLQIQDLRVIMMLAQARGPLTTTQISDRLEIPMRTVQRIITAIEAIPLQLRRDSAGMGGGIRLIGDLSLKVTLPSNLVEMAALKVARDRMRDSAGGTLLCEALEQFVERTLAQMTSEQRAISERFARFYRTRETKPRGTATPIATLVHKAIDEALVLIIEYVSPKELKPKRRELEPAGLWITDGRTYIVGFDREKQSMRTFALDRVRGARLSKDRFTSRGDFDVGAYFKNAVGAFVGGGPVDLELRLDAEAARRLGGKLPNDSARAVKRPDGGATLHYAAPLSDELLAWMVTLGPGVSVVAPVEASAFTREAFVLRAGAQPKAPGGARKPSAKRKKPLALPGPLARRMTRK